MNNINLYPNQFVPHFTNGKLGSKPVAPSRPPFEIQYMQSAAMAATTELGHHEKLCCFQVIWIKKGSGRFMLDMETYQINDNILYFISPGQLHKVEANGMIEGYRINFSPEFLKMSGGISSLPFAAGFKDQTGASQVIRVGQEIQLEIELVVKTMMQEYANEYPLKSEILMGLLKIFIAYFSRRFETKEPVEAQKSDAELFNRFMLSLDNNFVSKKNVADYADEFSVTPNYFSEIIKKVSGFTASHHIQQKIVLEAKRALLCSETTMKEIAFQLGFNDAAHFSKFYKNVTGQNFTEYKKERN